MMFDSWPGPSSPSTLPLFAAPCDPNNVQQIFTHLGATSSTSGVLELAKTPGMCVGFSDCDPAIGAVVRMRNNSNGKCKCGGHEQQWKLVKTPLQAHPGDEFNRGPTYTVQSSFVSGSGDALCLDVSAYGATLQRCVHSTRQIFYAAPGDSTPFSLETTMHDDGLCVTAPGPTCLVSGVEMPSAREQRDVLVSQLPPRISRGYREAYAASVSMMAKLRRRRRQQETCTGAFGAPQGPFGEIYSTHATVSNLTWRYVVGVQLTHDRNVSAWDLSLPIARSEDEEGAAFVSYEYAHDTTFAPQHSSDLRAATAGGWCG